MYLGKNKKQRLPLHYVESLDLLGLLVWYLDDGTWSNCTPNIGCMVFSSSDLIKAVEILNHKLNLSLRVRTENHHAGPYHRIVFPAKSRKMLFPQWIALAKRLDLPRCMEYKLKK